MGRSLRPLLKALMKEGTFSVVLLLLLLALIWGLGWYLGRENPDWMRWPIILTVIIIGMWASLFVIQKIMAVRSAVRIEQQLKAQSGAQLDGASADRKAEVEALRKKFDESLAALKRTKGGKSALFTLPWYVIIGPPGSGKTTALQESGLNFPAMQGGAKVRGIGGTRNCDWWFTEDGILLDTAGRYTTVADDQDEWLAFLEMIRASRKDKPINGAIVAISIDELLNSTQSELDQVAQDVRNRLDELSGRLQGVFPVYMMFTKCDLISGFVEFYEDFTKEERAQVWGYTMAYSPPEKQYGAIFDEECERIARNIRARQLELLGMDRPAAKKQAIYLFPRQFELVRGKMKEFVAQLFDGRAHQDAALLRGVYFTSGTQKGTPIDQILARLGAAMGKPAPAEASEERVEKKSYFINHLFSRIMFPDKTLAQSSSSVRRKRRATRLAIQFGSALGLLLALWMVISSFATNQGMISRVRAAGTEARTIEAKAAQAKTDAELLESLQKLEALRRQLAELDDERVHGRPLSKSYGMYQGRRMLDAGLQVYFDRLQPLVIKPCIARIETEMGDSLQRVRSNPNQEDYETLLDLWRVYRMMTGGMEPQPSLVAGVLRRNHRWARNLTTPHGAEIEMLKNAQLDFYVTQLKHARDESVNFAAFAAADAKLVEDVTHELRGNTFWVDTAYDAIIRHVSEKLPPLGVGQANAPNRDHLEFRGDETRERAARQLNAYTQSAWNTEVQPLLESRAAELSRTFAELGIEQSQEAILGQLVARHRRRATETWDLYMGGIYPRADMFTSVDGARGALRTLTGEQSPYPDTIRWVWNSRALNLGAGERIPGPGERETKAIEEAMGKLAAFREDFEKFAIGTAAGNRLGAKDALTELSQAFTNTRLAVESSFPDQQNPAVACLLRVLQSSLDALRADVGGEAEGRWNDRIVRFWNERMKDRYPFNADAAQNVAMADFAEMFNPVSGRIARLEKLLADIDGLRFAGRPLMSYTTAFEDTRRLAGEVRRAMFYQEVEAVNVDFTVTLKLRGRAVRCWFQVGIDEQGRPIDLEWNVRPRQTQDFTWKQPAGGAARMGARMRIKYGERDRDEEALGDVNDEWGLLKLLHKQSRKFEADATDERGTTFEAEWEVASRDDGQIYVAGITLRAAREQHPFREGFFTRFRVADKVNQ